MVAKVKVFFESIANGVFGILAEIALVAFFILSGLIICFIWWGIFK